jgi:putative membrane protein
LAVFFLACVVVAGAYGGWAVGRLICHVRALPAIAGLLALFAR